MTRRGLLAASLALAGGALGLAGCGLLRREEEVPDVTVSSGEDALAYALQALGERYGEGFSQAEGTEVTSYEPDYTGRLMYELCARPDSDPGKVFGCGVSTEKETGKLAYALMEDYTQYLFKGQMEGPFLEVVRGLSGLAGYSVQMAEPYVGDRDWRPDELDAYVNNGFTHPRVDVTLMMPADGTEGEWAGTIHECLEGIWGLGQRMYVYAGLEGYDPYSAQLYILDSTQNEVRGRDPEPPSVDRILELMWPDVVYRDGSETWDGTGDAGGPGLRQAPADYLVRRAPRDAVSTAWGGPTDPSIVTTLHPFGFIALWQESAACCVGHPQFI
ncbi:hypothetical protein Olsu_0234 [Olsenella uli DSM 7084]|uniref:Lipoprotein n=2 Tax=Olsenella uli TaxID=133926 RepID=E1QY99_OLSUV|nr:hypothetical protein Olsu_0234 [Olsenella uli DSM 7084]